MYALLNRAGADGSIASTVLWFATWAANSPASNSPRQIRVTAVLDRQAPSVAAAARAKTRPTRITLRAPTLSVHAPATRVATIPSRPANANTPMCSDEYENGGCDSATASPAHVAQNAKNQRDPRTAASRSAGKRTYRPGSPRIEARYPVVALPAATGSAKNANSATAAHAIAKAKEFHASRSRHQAIRRRFGPPG